MGDFENTDTREQEAMRKMFVGGLNRQTTDEAFAEYFSQFGSMEDNVIIRDPNTRESRGFGFVTYDSSSAVDNCFQSRPHVVDEKTLDVKRAMPREYNTQNAHAKTNKLYLHGVSPDADEESFKNELKDYIESRHSKSIGCMTQINIIKDKDSGKNKGFGFLECSDSDFADRLTISENAFTLNGKQMSLKKAEVKQDGQNNNSRGSFRGGNRGGSFGRGRGGSRGGQRGGSRGGSYGGRGGYGGGNYDYNQGGGYNQQPQQNTGYGGYGQNQQYQSYQNQSYQNQGGYAQNQYGQYNQGYGGQGSYNQNQGYGGNQSYGGNQGTNRFQPY